MTDLYLIAHKVRGEPAFDIAQRLLIGEEEAWVIPTSGHRAHPYWFLSLSEDVIPAIWHNPDHPCKFVPGNWPDHYSINDRKPEPSPREIDLEELGL